MVFDAGIYQVIYFIFYSVSLGNHVVKKMGEFKFAHFKYQEKGIGSKLRSTTSKIISGYLLILFKLFIHTGVEEWHPRSQELVRSQGTPRM